jgi:DNA-binding NarL/FixJ family response regulator
VPETEAGLLSASREIRVAVVEQHEILRRGLVASLAEDRALDMRSASADALDVQDVDIAIVSSAAAGRHRFPCPIVVCSDDPRGLLSVAAGNDVVGVLNMSSLTVAQLRATVHAAAAGLQVNLRIGNEGMPEPLDSRALRLLELMADGLSTREIADAMSYSERTIKKLIMDLEARMQARSRAQIVAQAIRSGVI